MSDGYEIVHEHAFDEQLANLAGDLERGDEFVSGAEWVLHRDPRQGHRITHHVWSLMCGAAGVKDAYLLYTFTDNPKRVYLLSIMATHRQDD